MSTGDLHIDAITDIALKVYERTYHPVTAIAMHPTTAHELFRSMSPGMVVDPSKLHIASGVIDLTTNPYLQEGSAYFTFQRMGGSVFIKDIFNPGSDLAKWGDGKSLMEPPILGIPSPLREYKTPNELRADLGLSPLDGVDTFPMLGDIPFEPLGRAASIEYGKPKKKRKAKFSWTRE